MPLGDRGTRLWTTCVRLLHSCAQLWFFACKSDTLPLRWATTPPYATMSVDIIHFGIFCRNEQRQTCHFLTMERSLSVVMSMPWKLVSTLRPWTSSDTSLNLRNATSSFCRSARDTSKTRPFSASDAISAKTTPLITTNYKYDNSYTHFWQ